MSINLPCPRCGEHRLYRSHARRFHEKLIKRYGPVKLYRCHECQWRGWISKRKLKNTSAPHQALLFYLFVVLAAVVVGIMMKNLIK